MADQAGWVEQWRMVVMGRDEEVVHSNVVMEVVVRLVVDNLVVERLGHKLMMRFQVSNFMVNMMDRFMVAMMEKRFMMDLDWGVIFAVNYWKNFVMMVDFMVFMMQMRNWRRRGRWRSMMRKVQIMLRKMDVMMKVMMK